MTPPATPGGAFAWLVLLMAAAIFPPLLPVFVIVTSALVVRHRSRRRQARVLLAEYERRHRIQKGLRNL